MLARKFLTCIIPLVFKRNLRDDNPLSRWLIIALKALFNTNMLFSYWMNKGKDISYHERKNWKTFWLVDPSTAPKSS